MASSSGREAGASAQDPALVALAGVFREAARDLARNAESLFAQEASDSAAASPWREELLREGISSSIDRYLEQWKERLDNRTASRTAELLVYNAAVVLGRRMATRELGARAEGQDPQGQAARFLALVAELMTLFGDPETWNGHAARRFALERLAGPLGLVDEDEAGRLFPVLDAGKDLLMEWVARSWRDMVGVLLDLPVQIPTHPSNPTGWADALDRQWLARALERAVANDGLVRVLDGHAPVVDGCFMTGDAAWMLVRERMDEGGRAVRIDRAAIDDVVAALERGEATSIDDWSLEDLACPAPQCAIRLPAHPPSMAKDTAEMMLVPGDDDPDAARLVVMDTSPDGWGVWVIPLASGMPGATPSATIGTERTPLVLTSAADAQPPGVHLCQFEVRPMLVRGDVRRPLVLVPGTPARIVHLGARLQNGSSEAGHYPLEDIAQLDGLDPATDTIDAAYSLPAGPEQPGRFLLVVCERTLHVYRSNIEGKPWWNGWPLVRVAHLALVPNVEVCGVAEDQVVFRVADGFWTFFPVQALVPGAPPPLASMHAEARGILFYDPTRAQDDDILPPPAWIRVGQVRDIATGGDGSIAVAFSDAGGIELYDRGDGTGPVHRRSIDGGPGMRGAHLAHLRLDDGRYLVLRACEDRIEYQRLSPASHARDGVFATNESGRGSP